MPSAYRPPRHSGRCALCPETTACDRALATARHSSGNGCDGSGGSHRLDEMSANEPGAERRRVETLGRLKNGLRQGGDWYQWGPYVSERQWGTVREDYSAHGTAWEYLPHDHARSRAYRWGEDGILGISDNHQRLCLALALWNGRDPILKERLFGLTGN